MCIASLRPSSSLPPRVWTRTPSLFAWRVGVARDPAAVEPFEPCGRDDRDVLAQLRGQRRALLVQLLLRRRPARRSPSAPSLAKARNSSLLETAGLSSRRRRSCRDVRPRRSGTSTLPSVVARPACLAALAIPFSRSTRCAASMSPPVSWSARFASMIPAPVISLSSLTSVAEITVMRSAPPAWARLALTAAPARPFRRRLRPRSRPLERASPADAPSPAARPSVGRPRFRSRLRV